MFSAFNTVYSALQGFLSRDFWTAAFVPVALFAALHALIATRLDVIPLTWVDVAGDNTALAKSLVLIVLALVLIGYLLQPLMPLFRCIADGTLLPEPVQTWLLASRQDTLTPDQGRLRLALSQRARLRRFCDELRRKDGPALAAYYAARQLGDVPGRADVADDAEAAIAMLDKMIDAGTLPNVEQMTLASDAVLAMLAVNNPGLRAESPAAPNAAQLLSMRTENIANRLVDLAQKAAEKSAVAYDRIEARLRLSKAIDQPRATALGDARFVAERYAQDVYAVRFDFLWPRLILALRSDSKDDAYLAAVDQGRARCDFAILCFMLSLSVPVAWLPYLLARPGHGPLFLAIGGSAPLIAGFFYRLAIEAQLAFADVVKATIDRHRLRVLKNFGQPHPGSRAEERLQWERIGMAEDNSELAYLAYAPESKS